MSYSLTIEHNNSSPSYKNDIKTWSEVLDILRNGLDQWTIRVYVYKWSKNDRCLGSKCITMGNLWEVCWNGTDKVLL